MSRHGSLVFIISDFRSLTEEAETYLAQLGRFNLVYGVHVFDELERNLPKPGQYSMTDGETFIKVDTSDNQHRADYSDAFALESRRVESCFIRSGGAYLAHPCHETPFTLRFHDHRVSS